MYILFNKSISKQNYNKTNKVMATFGTYKFLFDNQFWKLSWNTFTVVIKMLIRFGEICSYQCYVSIKRWTVDQGRIKKAFQKLCFCANYYVIGAWAVCLINIFYGIVFICYFWYDSFSISLDYYRENKKWNDLTLIRHQS